MALYSFALTVGLVAWALWRRVPMLKAEQRPPGLSQRLGRVPAWLGPAVAGQRVVWVHAVSVGEVLAASRLVGELEAALGDGWMVAVSTTTRTGQALARERFGAERVFYMPLDFAFAVRPYLRLLRPAVVVLIESEVWPRMMHECRKVGTPVIVVNARVSDRSFGRSLKVRWIWSRVLRKATLWLAQTEEDARRLVEMGAPVEAVRVGGNLKYDVRAPRVSRVAELIREAAGGRPVVVAGSTVADEKEWKGKWEEEVVIRAWEGDVRRKMGALLVIAPRHPERFSVVESLVAEFRFACASDWVAAEEGTPPFAKNAKDGPPGFEDGPAHVVPGRGDQLEVVLLDTIGDLAAVYGVADVAFVGGSLVKRGGHNPLEPAQFGVPVVMGPSYENFRGVVETMREAGAISIVGEVGSGRDDKLEGGMEEGPGLKPDSSARIFRGLKPPAPSVSATALEVELVRLLTDREDARAMGERGRRVFEEQQGATGRAVEAIVGMVKK